MRIVIALLMTLPLIACEPESIMERSSEALENVSDDVTDTIEGASENVEDVIEQVTD